MLDVADTAPNPASRAAEQETGQTVLRAIAALREKYRVVLYLRLVDEISLCEIAERLGLKESTVRMRLQRGLTQLRKSLKHLELER